jgi:hypothetical protein
MTYYVSVDGCTAPKVAHESKFDAIAEARRLAGQSQNHNRMIRVFKEVGVMSPVSKPTHIWMDAADQEASQSD